MSSLYISLNSLAAYKMISTLCLLYNINRECKRVNSCFKGSLADGSIN